MTSYYPPDRRGRSSRRYDDQYDDRYDNYNNNYDTAGHHRYRHADYDALDDYHPATSGRRSKSSSGRAARSDQYQHQHQQQQQQHRHREHRSAPSAHSNRRAPSSRRSASTRRSSSASTSRELRHVVTSALTAGAVEAFRLRKTPGKWTDGHKAGRVATVALGAAVADTAVEDNNDSGEHSRRHVVESTLAGLLTDRLVNGSRKRK